MIYKLARVLIIALCATLISDNAFAADATPVGPPTAPTTITASLANPSSTTSTDVIVEWSGGSDGGSAVTGYQVTPYLATDYTTAASVSCSKGGANLSDSCTVQGLAYATTYKFKVTRTTAIGSATSALSSAVSTNSQAQTVTISGTPTSYQFGDPDFQLSATATSGLSVAWSIPSTTDICSVDLSGTVNFLKSGTCTIRATQDGSGSAYASAYAETTVTSSVALTATLGSATSVQSSQATLNAIVPFPGVNVTPTFCVSTINSVSTCSLPSGVSIGSYSPSSITASSSTSVTAVASGLRESTTYYFWITVTGSGASPYSTSTGSFTTVSGPSLSYSGSQSGTVGASMSGTLTASSGSGVYASWSAATLPTGLTFNSGVTPTTSTLTGTPTAAGTYISLFTVTDSSGLETQLNVTFTITSQPSTDSGSSGSSSGSTSSGSFSGDSSPGSTTGTTNPGSGAVTPTPPAPVDPSTTIPSSPQSDPGTVDIGIGDTPNYLFENDVPQNVIIDVVQDGKGLSFTALDWKITAHSEKSKLSQGRTSEDKGRITSEVTGKITLEGSGFKAGTQVDFYAFSSPVWLGGVFTTKVGEFKSTLTLPKSILAGEHTIKVLGVGPAGQKRNASLPFLVVPKGTKSFFIPSNLIERTLKGPRRTTILVKDIPSKSVLSWKGEVNDKTRGIKSATIKLRLLTITPDQNFSGVILLPLQIKYAGITVSRTVALTIKPLNPGSPRHAIGGVGQTIISWTKSLNATKYVVTKMGEVICQTSGASCTINSVAGPNTKFTINALGADGTESDPVTTKYSQSKSTLLATVNFANNYSTLDTRAIATLEKLISVIMQEGFSNISIVGYTDSVGKKATNIKLSEARAKAVSDFISGNIVGSVNAIGKGRGKPITSNATKDGRAANRRVEIYVG